MGKPALQFSSSVSKWSWRWLVLSRESGHMDAESKSRAQCNHRDGAASESRIDRGLDRQSTLPLYPTLGKMLGILIPRLCQWMPTDVCVLTCEVTSRPVADPVI
jgi:hypothetical protein